MGDTHFYEPKNGHRLPHDPFKAIVAPRPIGWISTVEGRPNVAPYSFFNAFCDSPLGFSEGWSFRHCGGRDDRAVRLPGRLRRGHTGLRDAAPVLVTPLAGLLYL
jgi:hypothetical protein